MLHLLKSSAEEGQSGKILNLLSNDLAKLELGLQLMHNIWVAPLQAIVFSIVIYMEIGVSAVIGMALIVSLIPLQGKFNKLLCSANRHSYHIIKPICSTFI